MPTISDLGYDSKTKTKRNQSLSAMKQRIKYVYDKSTLINSIAVNTDSVDVVYKEFVKVKEEFGKKNKGNNFFHYVVSFSDEDTITKSQAMDIVDKFLQDEKFEGFQIFYGTHQDTDNLHCHILINSVNMCNGKKWHMKNNEWLTFQIKLNKIALEYGCKVPEKIAKLINIQQEKSKNTSKVVEEKKEYEEKMIFKNKSWKEKVKQNINYIISNSISLDDLKNNLRKIDYNLYKNKDNKYVVFIKSIQKRISFEKLNLSEEQIISRLNFNSSLDDNDLKDMQENIKDFTKSNLFNCDNILKDIKEKSINYDYEKINDENRKIYYKDLVADIKKFIKTNNHLKNGYEKELSYILKYSLNNNNTLKDATNLLKELGINVEQKDNILIIDIDNIKISSSYLKIDLQKELDSKPVSWKYELFLNLQNAKYKAKNKEEFINILKENKIDLVWTDTRQYITFIDKYGNKRRNNKIFPKENWTKEKLEEQFEKNLEKYKKQIEAQDINNSRIYVKNIIYNSLKNSLNFNTFEKKLNENDIKIKNINNNTFFEYKNNTFSKSDFFDIDKEYIDDFISNNQITTMSSLNSIFRTLSYNGKPLLSSGKFNRTMNNSLFDRKNYIAEVKKGKNSIAEKENIR